MKRKRTWIAVSVLIILGLLMGGFGCAAPTPTPTPTPTPKPTPTPTPTPTPAKEFPKQVRFLSGGVGTANFSGQSYWMGELYKKLNIPAGAFPGGPQFNLPVLARGDAEFSYSNLKFAYQAYNGVAPFTEKMTNLRWVTTFMIAAYAFVVRNDSPIKSMSDLVGKKVALAQKGSGAEQVGLMQLAAAGITPTTIQTAGGLVTNMSYASMGDGLADKTIDAAFFGISLYGVHPSLAMVEQRFGVRLLDIPEEAKKALKGADPLIALYEVPGGLYKGSPKPVATLSDPWGAVTRANISDDFIYTFLELIYSDTVAKETVKQWDLYTGFGDPAFGLLGANTIPMHPGAAKFFKNKFGIDVKTKGIEIKE